MKSVRHLVMPVRVLPHHCIGGMPAVAWDLATALVRKGLEVTVLTARIAGRPAVFADAGVKIHALPGTSWRRYGRRWWRETRSLFERELIERCDLVLSISAGGFGLLPLRHRSPRIPFVFQAHGTSVGEVLSKWRSGSVMAMASSIRNITWIAKDLAAYRCFDAIVAVGDQVATEFASWPIARFVDSGRLKVIQNGIDTNLFRPDAAARQRVRTELGWGGELKVIVSASRLHKQKGLDLALEAFALLARQDCAVRYLIVGEGPEEAALRRKVANLGIEGEVHFTGGVAREQVPRYLNAGDAMLFTTTHVEGNPLNVLEALATGLPVVASRHLYRKAPPSDNILLADQRDSTSVVGALRRALQIEPRHRSVLPVGFSMAESVAAYLALFEDLAGRRR
jgi:glycosyltransferase involved in cell wall biosynthesis